MKKITAHPLSFLALSPTPGAALTPTFATEEHPGGTALTHKPSEFSWEKESHFVFGNLWMPPQSVRDLWRFRVPGHNRQDDWSQAWLRWSHTPHPAQDFISRLPINCAGFHIHSKSWKCRSVKPGLWARLTPTPRMLVWGWRRGSFVFVSPG